MNVNPQVELPHMTEALAQKICNTPVDNISWQEAVAADLWIKEYTLESLHYKIKRRKYNSAVGNFVCNMAQIHWGSAEANELLTRLGCFPEWFEANKESLAIVRDFSLSAD